MVDQCGEISKPGPVLTYLHWTDASTAKHGPPVHDLKMTSSTGSTSFATLPLDVTLEWSAPINDRIQGFNMFLIGEAGNKVLIDSVNDPTQRSYAVNSA